ncbi:MAG: hypothetical protein ACRDQZ_19750, partial [Mycobacteriales bacterium]
MSVQKLRSDGCRIGECLAIGWEEVDLDRATAEVCWRLVRRRGVGLLRLASTKTGHSGERLILLPSWAMTMLKRRRLAIEPGVQPVFPDSLGGWRDPSNVRRIWRRVRDDAGIQGWSATPCARPSPASSTTPPY